MIDITFHTDADSITVPSRFEPYLFAKKDTDWLCNMTRHHDGFKREVALRKLLQQKPSPLIAAYCLVALADYVIEASQLVVNDTPPELRKIMTHIIKKNPIALDAIESMVISYWNEYYRSEFGIYQEYPPYHFIQELKNPGSLT